MQNVYDRYFECKKFQTKTALKRDLPTYFNQNPFFENRLHADANRRFSHESSFGIKSKYRLLN